MNRLNKILGLGLISLFTLSACGTATDFSNSSAPESIQISSFNPGTVNYSPVVQVFLNNVSSLGVSLNDNQIREISIQRHVHPSGFWAARPALNLTSEQNLDIHFNKHKNEFQGIFTREIYLQRALEFQNRLSPSITYYFDTTSFAQGYQSNVVKYDARTREFGAVKDNGDITTYYTSDIPSRKRFIIVPENFSF